jgi:integrase
MRTATGTLGDGKTKVLLTSATTRKRIPRRKKPYFITVAPGVLLGYLCRGSNAAGEWQGRVKIGYAKTANGQPYAEYKNWRVGTADDLAKADGTTIVSYSQAFSTVSAEAPLRAKGLATTALTVRAACERYLTYREEHKGEQSRYHAEGKFKKWVYSHPIGETEVNKLTLRQMQDWHAGMVRRDPEDPDCERRSKDSANKALRELKAALNHAYHHRDETGVPSCDAWGSSLKQFADVAAQRTYNLTIPTALKLIEAAEPGFADLLKAAFYTGARPGDLRKLRVKDFSARTKQLCIPKGKTKSRVTVLTTEGAEFFVTLIKDKMPNAPLLTKSDGTAWETHDQIKPMQRTIVKAGLMTAEQLKAMPKRERPSLYSWRHAYISRAIEQGMPLLLIAQNVGNSVAMIEKHYAKIIEEKRQELIEKSGPSLKQGAA